MACIHNNIGLMIRPNRTAIFSKTIEGLRLAIIPHPALDLPCILYGIIISYNKNLAIFLKREVVTGTTGLLWQAL